MERAIDILLTQLRVAIACALLATSLSPTQEDATQVACAIFLAAWAIRRGIDAGFSDLGQRLERASERIGPR